MGINDHQPTKQRSGRGDGFKKTSRNPFATQKVERVWFLSSTDAELLFDAVGSAVQAGCLISLSQTRDGSALCITIMDGDDRHRTYCISHEEIEQALTAIVRMFAKPELRPSGMEEVEVPVLLPKR